MYVQFHNVCATILLFKPRGPESGGREAVRQSSRDKLVVKQVAEKVRLSWALNQLMSEILVYFI